MPQPFFKSRDDEIRYLFRQALDIASFPTTYNKLYEIVASLPATRYHIDQYRALRCYRKYLSGHPYHFRSPYKARLFDALYAKVDELRPLHKDKSLSNIIMIALYTPAPCVGVHPASIRHLLNHHKHD